MKNFIKLILLVFIFSFSNQIEAQKAKKIVIKGQVLDSNKNPIPDTMIFVDNKKQKVKTSTKGYYSLRLKEKPTKLMFYSEKYGVIDYVYTGKKVINITFDIPASKTKDHTLSARVKNNERVPNNYRYTNIYEYLRGKVAGVRVIEGEPVIIRIRGISSLKGSSEPLFVLNDIVLASRDGIESINPNDIKSVKVLKGSETSQYGVRGAAGVIEITTFK